MHMIALIPVFFLLFGGVEDILMSLVYASCHVRATIFKQLIRALEEFCNTAQAKHTVGHV